jgi:formylmethanofuran dehydrogenase subunit D
VSATLQSSGEAAASTKTKGEELGEEFEEHYALADFTAEDASQVSFKTGDKVFVKTKDQSGEQKKGDVMKINTYHAGSIFMLDAYFWYRHQWPCTRSHSHTAC